MSGPIFARLIRRGLVVLGGSLAVACVLGTLLPAQTPTYSTRRPATDPVPDPVRHADFVAPAEKEGAVRRARWSWGKPSGGDVRPVEHVPPADHPVYPEHPAPPGHHEMPGEVRVPFPMPPELVGVDLTKQTDADKAAKSDSCLTCHTTAHDPHFKTTVKLGCTDCHGGNTHVAAPPEGCPPPGTKGRPRGCPAAPPHKNPLVWRTSGNPVRSYTALNHESPDFVRFINPGDLRIAHISCGTTNCHPNIVTQVKKNMMTHGCMLYGHALYANGAVPFKRARYGELYSMHGRPLRIQTVPPPTDFELKRGVIPFLDPFARYEVAQPSNVLRIFERGGKFRFQAALPIPELEPGRPILVRLSNRGLGTENRTDPVFIGLQKTRLYDPTLNFLGTNDHPGDFRSSGCTACHVIYANDRSPIHSGPYAKYGNRGTASDLPEDHPDPTIPKDEPGHPIAHRFAKGNGIPTSQCMVCHVHPGTTVMNSYIGYMWYDEESDGPLMYPEKQKYPTAEEYIQSQLSNPDEIAARGNWSDPRFLFNIAELNDRTQHNHFADFNGHGWVFRAVFKRDRKGNLLDYNNNIVPEDTPELRKAGINMPLVLREQYRNDAASSKTRAERNAWEAHTRAGVPMHLMDLHAEKGMHCVDCHFIQDVHGNTRLQMEVRAAIEIACTDCHGTVTGPATLRTSGPAAYTSNPDAPHPDDPKYGRDLTALRTPDGKPRFERRGDKIYQRSMVEPNLVWEIVQVKDTIDPKSEHYNAKAALAKTVRFEGGKMVYGTLPGKGPHADAGCAHCNSNMSCQSCHSSWNPSCYGCHLPQKANIKMPQLHNDGDVTRNYVHYNFQTLRQDTYMLARDGTATGNRINPSRSSCAIHVGSYNDKRESIYVQQQTISGEGFSGIAFSTNVPHTVGGKNATKLCTDCHVSEKNDNNAIMAQLLMHGTGFMNFVGRYAWMGAGAEGLYAVVATERDEPQAVIGSYLHKYAFPDRYEEHVKRKGFLEEYHEHPGVDVSDSLFYNDKKAKILDVQNRGEYLYCACGEHGLRVIDISFIDHKGFSERIFTAPVSPIGQKFYVRTKYATSVTAPCTMAPDPTRKHYIENEEGRVHPMYAYIYVTDKYEGLILVGAATLLDGNPLNNFLDRDVVFNPKGLLKGARAMTFVGTYGYVLCDAGMAIIDFDDPTKPCLKAIVDHTLLKCPKAVACQFRYCYVADEDGVKVFDITDPERPRAVSQIPIHDVHNIYLARTYAYLAAGKKGLVILDIENPEMPRVDQIYDAGGRINDLHDVQLGITYSSLFAYLADGKNGMRIVQLTSPDTPGVHGFSPRPTPRLIATFKFPKEGEALSIARGVDRDRAVDESGNQLCVFGRVGARPFNKEEQRKMYLHHGHLYRVSDDPNWPGYHRVKP